MVNPSDYYISRKPLLLKEFDLYVKHTLPLLVRYFGEGNINALIAETRGEYENLIPQLPYIGGRQPFTQFVISTGILLAVYRIARKHGKTVEQTGNWSMKSAEPFCVPIPPFWRTSSGI
jgi:hypothetical protein